jgi:hypothetical protein
MNDRLVEILSQRADFNITGEDKKRLDFFSEYLDHGSLFLVGFEPGEDPEFTFTNDAQRYRFRMSEIREHVIGMKSGKPLVWEEIEYELINKGNN